jgi:Flp pilus assembly protein TadD
MLWILLMKRQPQMKGSKIPTAQTRLDNGKKLFDQGNYDGAIQELNEAIRLDPKLAGAYIGCGNAYL